ncbi:MAG TPA: metallophosphoesterase family protein [Terriglobia bacterium]|nr:metallophosphoesterase family protein [Terriglobia bacterium]
MRYLIFSDTHANLEALETCLVLAQGKYDQAICLGDLVGYGPDPNSVIERVRRLARIIIRGNHDKACAGISDAKDFNVWARLATAWTRHELTAEHFAYLRDLPPGPVLLETFGIVHGAPLDEDEYLLAPTDALPALKALPTQLVFFGHTHIQGGFMLSPQGRFQSIRVPSPQNDQPVVFTVQDGGRYLINPGSVGQPRDGDPRAAFAIFDETHRMVEYYRTAYDIAKTQEKMRKASLPDPLIRRLEFGR